MNAKLAAALLLEAVVVPSEDDIRAILGILQDTSSVREANQQLARFHIRVDPHDQELRRSGAPARAGLDGIVIRDLPRNARAMQAFEHFVRHELVHGGQMERAAKHGDVLRMYYGDQERIAPAGGGGHPDMDAYHTNPQEIMAAAHDAVRQMLSMGLPNREILRTLQHQPPPPMFKGPAKERFLRYAVQYLDRLEAPDMPQLPPPPPPGFMGGPRRPFPGGPGSMARFPGPPPRSGGRR